MKKDRHSEIVDIILAMPVSTQEELLSILRSRGYTITQATVSRDIRALGLVKMTSAEGLSRYALPASGTQPKYLQRYHTILREAVYGAAPAGNLVVIRCYVGMANAAAAAFDALNFEHVVGTIAGDDTIFVAVDSPGHAVGLVEKLTALL